MNSPDGICIYLIDSHGLRAIAMTRSNRLKAHCLDLLQRGVIAVPNCVWDEFKEAYDDEAEDMGPAITTKISANKKYNAGVAKIADQLNSKFSVSPYDTATDFFAAAIAVSEGYTLITTTEQLTFYSSLNSCKAIDLTSLAVQ